jgi:hypothetical protein
VVGTAGRAGAFGALGLPLAAAWLAGCGGAGEGGGGTSSAAATGSISFMSRDNGSDLEPYKQGLALFNGKQSRIKVTHDIVSGNFEQKLQTVVAAGTPPDVSYMHACRFPTRSGRGPSTWPRRRSSPTPAAPTASSARWTSTAGSPSSPCSGRTTPTS